VHPYHSAHAPWVVAAKTNWVEEGARGVGKGSAKVFIHTNEEERRRSSLRAPGNEEQQ